MRSVGESPALTSVHAAKLPSHTLAHALPQASQCPRRRGQRARRCRCRTLFTAITHIHPEPIPTSPARPRPRRYPLIIIFLSPTSLRCRRCASQSSIFTISRCCSAVGLLLFPCTIHSKRSNQTISSSIFRRAYAHHPYYTPDLRRTNLMVHDFLSSFCLRRNPIFSAQNHHHPLESSTALSSTLLA